MSFAGEFSAAAFSEAAQGAVRVARLVRQMSMSPAAPSQSDPK